LFRASGKKEFKEFKEFKEYEEYEEFKEAGRRMAPGRASSYSLNSSYSLYSLYSFLLPFPPHLTTLEPSCSTPAWTQTRNTR
jgi:hypothetical protein